MYLESRIFAKEASSRTDNTASSPITINGWPARVGADGIVQMLGAKLALDPRGLLGRGNLFPESDLPDLG